MWLRLIPWGLAALGIAAAGFLFWRLGETQEELGAAREAAKAYAKALSDKASALQGRAQTEQRVRQMAPEEKLRGLK